MKIKRKKIVKIIVSILAALLVVVGGALLIINFSPTMSADRPSNSSTEEQPFVKKMAGINKFRIPALVTLNDGTLVAACDARWNTFIDCGGLDTIVSRSSDNGKSWDYTFANYLGDNGNRFDLRSSTFIDPALICSSDGVLYVATTFYPADVSLKSSPLTPSKDKAFDENGRLLICEGNSGEYTYTLGDFDAEGYASVIDKDGNPLPDYLIDKYYNIYNGDKQKGNLFFKNAPFSVVPTTYIYLNVSYDNGKTWDDPSLLDVKSSGVEFFGIAPGRGLELDDGTLIFSTYCLTDNDGDTQRSSFIFSKDNGKTWDVAPALDQGGWSSESQLVKLSNKKLRCFFRNGNSRICYSDFSLDDMIWSKPVITNIENCSSCMISAINYSRTIDGKRVIVVSCPTNVEKRADGCIFVFTLDDNDDMTLYRKIPINEGDFAYSCLTETTDGKIAILYEIDNHQITFKTDIDIL